MTKKITIGICDTEAKYANYPAWLKGDNKAVEIVVLSWEKSNSDALLQCQGLVLTGGIDMDPFFYPPHRNDYPNKPEKWNPVRDQFEMDLFTTAQKMMIPVLGICRGLQLVNTALGGSLIPDLEEMGKQNHRSMQGIDHVHTIRIMPNSLLAQISTVTSGTVNSAHHQAINQPAESLVINCFSDDGIAEGVEWKNKENHTPLLCVQWHPERIENKQTNPLSKNIREWFLMEAEKYIV